MRKKDIIIDLTAHIVVNLIFALLAIGYLYWLITHMEYLKILFMHIGLLS